LTIVCANPHVAHLDFILACLSDPSVAVRGAAADALARQPTVDVVGTIEPLLRDPDAEVRRSVVKILSGLRSKRVRQLLASQAEADAETLVDTVQALRKLGDTTVVPLLTAIFDREGPGVKLAVVEAFKEMHDPAAEPLPARQLGNPDPGVAARRGAGAGRHAIAECDPSAGAGGARSGRDRAFGRRGGAGKLWQRPGQRRAHSPRT
jgi:HEAT repeat protein